MIGSREGGSQVATTRPLQEDNKRGEEKERSQRRGRRKHQIEKAEGRKDEEVAEEKFEIVLSRASRAWLASNVPFCGGLERW